MKRTILICLSILILLVGVGATLKHAKAEDDSDKDRWEYLVVSGANNVNFSTPSTGTMRKEAAGFQRENFVLEQQMDKLGERGWQLVSVAGSERDSTYYFKRRK